MRSLIRARRIVAETADQPRRVVRGRLAEEYDGIGQFVMVSLSNAAVGSAFKARVASGDFGTGQTMPAGTPVSLFCYRGQMEILSMGVK